MSPPPLLKSHPLIVRARGSSLSAGWRIKRGELSCMRRVCAVILTAYIFPRHHLSPVAFLPAVQSVSSMPHPSHLDDAARHGERSSEQSVRPMQHRRALSSPSAGSLCSRCEKGFEDLLRRDMSSDWPLSIKPPSRYSHYLGMLGGARRSCVACNLFQKYADLHGHLRISALVVDLDPELAPAQAAYHYFRLLHSEHAVAAFRICHISGDDSSRFLGSRMEPVMNLGKARTWYEDCTGRHSKCAANNAQVLPTRLIEVGSATVEPRLVNSGGQIGSYFALSYCWGNKKPLVTTASNLRAHLQILPFETLPKTFQDAITVTRAFGIRYLWIDALCVVQDSKNDWHVECAQMDKTYCNAALTIAVREAADATVGFLDRIIDDVPPHCQFDIRSVDNKGKITLRLEDVSNVTSLKGFFSEHDFPFNLDSRGWTFQERLLSVRILQFGSKEMSFACNSTFSSEFTRYPSMYNDQLYHRDLVIPKNAIADNVTDHAAWRRVVENHSRRRLTYGDDKLPSLSGIAARFQRERANDEFIAGIWKSDVIESICWFRTGWTCLSHFAAQTPGPSWSWASCHYDIDFPPSIKHLVPQAELIDSRATLLGANPFGPVKGAVLLFRAFLAPISSLRKEHAIYEDRLGRTSHQWGQQSQRAVFFNRDADVEFHGITILDSDLPILDEIHGNKWIGDAEIALDVHLMLLRAGSEDVEGQGPWFALIFESIPEQPGTFRRLGLLYHEWNWAGGNLSEDGPEAVNKRSFEWMLSAGKRVVPLV